MPDYTPTAGLPYPNDADTLADAVKAIPKQLALAVEDVLDTAGLGASIPRRGNVVVTTDANGDAGILYTIGGTAAPFPTGVNPVVFVSLGDDVGGTVRTIPPPYTDNASVRVRIRNLNGTPLVGSARVHYIAFNP